MTTGPRGDGERRRTAVLFDLGNTLARYYERAEFGPILERSVQAVLAELGRRGIRAQDFDAAMGAAREENREALDFRFTPMDDVESERQRPL